MPRETVTEPAPAKINLTLHVTGRRGEGYHLLDSLVGFASIGDRITARCEDVTTLTLRGPFGACIPSGSDNLVLRAAALAVGQGGVAFTLDKHLPPASGIGGGSADAAAAIRAALRLCLGPAAAGALRARLAALDPAAVLALGADLPVCLWSKPARMRGIGEALSFVTLPRVPVVLVNPGVEVPTPTVFRALSRRANPPMPDALPQWPDAAALAVWLAAQRNDLEAPARAIAPVIGEVLEALASLQGVLLARMSGSGATCFALFDRDEAAQQAREVLAGARPDWWVVAGHILAGDAAGPVS